MSRLNKYLSEDFIVEKVTQQEIDSALKNPNVLIGCEFEFILEESIAQDPNYDDNMDAYDDYQAQCEDFEREYDEYLEEYEKYREAEEAYFNWEEAHDEWVSQHDQWEENPAEYGDEPIEPEEPEIVQEPMLPAVPDIPDYIDWITHQEQVQYCMDYGKPINIPVPDRYKYGESGPEAFREWIYGNVDNDLLNQLRKWDIKDDGSLGDDGVEVATDPMNLDEFLTMVPKMFKIINKVGYTNSSCGFHIGISLKNVPNLQESLDIVKLALFTEEELVFKFFDGRQYNTYVQSSKMHLTMMPIETINNFIDVKALKQRYSRDHHMAINIEHLKSNNQYIEFRYLGGRDYHKKWNEIKRIVAHYIYNISLACDPNFKKKEYIHKLSRMLNKIELVNLIREYDYMKGNEDYIKTTEIVEYRKKMKQLEMRINTLKNKYNVTKFELDVVGKLIPNLPPEKKTNRTLP